MKQRPLPRLALRREEAADSLGMSVDSFERHVAPELRAVYAGRVVVYPVKELERWLERNAVAALPAVSVTAGGSATRMGTGAA